MKALKEYFDSHESAPSACLMVSQAAGSEVTQAHQDLIYERSEGANDQERNLLLSVLTDAQLIGLYEDVLTILLEKISFYENQLNDEANF